MSSDPNVDNAFKFDLDGFLTDRIGELEAGIHAAHCALFASAQRINRDCHELLFRADIRNRDIQAIIAATLFMRILEHYQATTILLGRGMIAAAKVTLRALIETTFKIRAIASDPDSLKLFINEDQLHRKKLINKVLDNPHPNMEEIRKLIPSDLVENLDQGIQTSGAKTLRTEDWSRRAGMHDWYIATYSSLSKAVHTQVRELEMYLTLGESDEIEQFRYAPGIDEIPLLVLTAADSLLIGASTFDTTFEMDFGLKGHEHRRFVEAGFRALNDESSE